MLLALAFVLLPSAARAQTFTFRDADGSIHYTNAPTDPRYRRMEALSGTAAGWLRVPGGDPLPYTAEIRAAAERYGVPHSLVSAVIRAESGFNARAVSRKGAQGLMQLMPATASLLGVQDSFDPRDNIEGGVRHLRGLIDRFANNLPLALAAYNAGERAVQTHRGIPPYAETREYVDRVLRFYGAVTGSPAAPTTYRTVDAEGTVTYTNIPPRGQVIPAR
jgi:soluble lytic murein transglycosylase-like protein